MESRFERLSNGVSRAWLSSTPSFRGRCISPELSPMNGRARTTGRRQPRRPIVDIYPNVSRRQTRFRNRNYRQRQRVNRQTTPINALTWLPISLSTVVARLLSTGLVRDAAYEAVHRRTDCFLLPLLISSYTNNNDDHCLSQEGAGGSILSCLCFAHPA